MIKIFHNIENTVMNRVLSWFIKLDFVILLLFGFNVSIFSQEYVPGNDPVTNTFESGTFIETQTIETPFNKEIEFMIHHRFGLTENGIKDVFGIYAPSNIRLGLNYGITDDIMIGYGYTKDFKQQEFQGKWKFLKQTESNSIPVSAAVYTNLVVDSRDKDVFDPNKTGDYKSSDRISYFTQLLVAHKVNDNFSMQIAPSFTHINKVDTLIEHDEITITFTGRAKITPSTSFILEYDQPLRLEVVRKYFTFGENKNESNLSFGAEIGTSTHVFQVFMTTYSGITPQRNIIFNRNNWTKGDFLFGFNILVRF